MSTNPISYFAETNFREEAQRFGIYQNDRFFHTYLIGKTGSGKSTLVKNLILADILAGRGLSVFDLHNDLINDILRVVPSEYQKSFISLDLTKANLQWGYNPLRKVSYEKRSLVASGVLQSFQKIFGAKSWGSKVEHVLRMCLLSLLDQPFATLADIRPLLLNEAFRKACVKSIINSEIKDFWLSEYPRMTKNDILPVLNKVSALLAHPVLKRFLIDNRKQLSLRQTMDTGKVLLVNISRGELGSDVAFLVGSLLLNALSSAGFSRSNITEDKRRPFFLYLDEFQFYTNPMLIEMLAELRKFKIGIVCANQYLSQISADIRDALLGNVGTLICFRLSQSDAKFMQQEFYPVFHHADFTGLANYEIYLRLMINGKPSKPFSARTLPFPQMPIGIYPNGYI